MKNKIAKTIANNALSSMLYEVYTTPKPGLVDRFDSGAHSDMNIDTFIKSSLSLLPTMYECALAGIENIDKSPRETLDIIRSIGIKGEKAMFKATNGINTQKGIIFALGLLCATIGRLKASFLEINIDSIADTIKVMTNGIVERELGILKKDITKRDIITSGEKLYLSYGVDGIRGEAERGFPSVIYYGIPILYKELKLGLSFNDSLVNTILSLMTVVEDTTVIWRTGLEGLSYMRNEAKKVIELGGMSTSKGKTAIEKMNKNFINKNISPGGCADLLAVTIMIYLTINNIEATSIIEKISVGLNEL